VVPPAGFVVRRSPPSRPPVRMTRAVTVRDRAIVPCHPPMRTFARRRAGSHDAWHDHRSLSVAGGPPVPGLAGRVECSLCDGLSHALGAGRDYLDALSLLSLASENADPRAIWTCWARVLPVYPLGM